MAYMVYPEQQLTPHLLIPNDHKEIELVNPSPASWGDDPGQDAVMFIRISSPASPNPSIEIMAREVGSPAEWWVPITSGSVDIMDGVIGHDVPAGRVHWKSYNAVTGVLSLEIVVTFGSDDQTEWWMKITNNDSNSQGFVWVIANVAGEDEQPWIEVEPDEWDFGAKHLTGLASISKEITVRNRGTGTLTLTKPEPIPPSTTIDWSLGNGFQIFDYDTAGESFPSTVEPNEEPPTALKVVFKPDSVGPAPPLSYEVACDDNNIPSTAGATHSNKVILKGTAGMLEVMLLLDGSGSMAWDPQGNMGVPPDQSRWSHLANAVDQFLTLLGNLGEGTGRFGVAVFPDITQPPVTAPSANSLPYTAPEVGRTEATEITTEITTGDAIGKAKGAVDGQQQPTGGTPMGKGIEETTGTADAYGYFQSSSVEIDYSERWLVLMSDGEHNWNPPHPHDFFREAEGYIDTGSPFITAEPFGNAPDDGQKRTFQDKKIKVFTIGYGDPASTVHVNHGLLKLITGKSGVNPVVSSDPENTFQNGYQVAYSTSVGDIQKAFRRFLESVFNLVPVADPQGVLTGSAPRARHEVTINHYDSKVIFIVDWWNFGRDRVEVSLVTPLCETITPRDAAGTSGLSYHEHNRYKMFIVDDYYLRNTGGESRYGAWKFVISGQHLDEGDSEPYAYSVITRSRAQMAVGVSGGMHAAGDAITIKANMTIDGTPVLNPSFTLHMTGPVHSKHNWLARTRVRAEDFAQWEKKLAGQDTNALDLKARAAADKGLKFENILRSRSIPMVREGESSSYAARIENTTVPGNYEFRVTAVAETTSGVAIRRERTMTVYVGVRPEAEYTLVDIDYRRVLEAKAPMNEIHVWIMLRDRFGNIVLVDPKIDPSICITAEGAEPTDDLVGHLDGSYSRTYRYAPGIEPFINLRVGGQEVVSKLDLSPAERLRYVNRVIAFTEGREAKKGANQHDQPKAILGSVLDKDLDEFVSLGGFGSITIGFDGEGILAAGKAENDITVFVRRDEDLRPYAVEARPRTAKDEWVELGMSPGVTQSFSLGKAGLRKATAIRITDRSGRTTDSEGKPIATPGVSMRGVGVRRVGHL